MVVKGKLSAPTGDEARELAIREARAKEIQAQIAAQVNNKQ